MKLKEILPFFKANMKLLAYHNDGSCSKHYASHWIANGTFAKYMDYEVFRISAFCDETAGAWVQITVKEYHAHL